MKRSSQSGFTMLELLVTMIILMAIYVIAIPQYNGYRERTEKAAIISECRSMYRAFVVFYLEQEWYPSADWGDHLFNNETFYPLVDESIMGGAPFDINIEKFRDKLAGRKAEKFDSPDDMGDNQEFFLVLPWAKDPTVKFVIASADNVIYEDGTSVDSGNWMDGVFVTQGGNIIR